MKIKIESDRTTEGFVIVPTIVVMWDNDHDSIFYVCFAWAIFGFAVVVKKL